MLKKLLKPSAFKLALLIGLAFAVFHFVHHAAALKGSPFAEIDLLEQKALDIKFRRRGPVPSSGQVIIAGIDEKSVQKYGLWPWKRSVVARAFKTLNDAGALAVAADITYSDEDRATDLRVNEVIDDVVARASVEPKSTKEVDTLLALNPPADLREKLEALRAAITEDASQFTAIKEAVVHNRVEDPTLVLARALEQSPRVILGFSTLSPADVEQVPQAVRERDEANTERFLLKDLYEFTTEQKVVQGESATSAAVNDWAPVWEHVDQISPKQLPAAPGIQGPLPVLARAAHHLGNIEASPDGDGTVRTYAPIRRVGKRLIPSLAIQAAAVALDAEIVPLRENSIVAHGLAGVGLRKGDAATGLRLTVPVNPFDGQYIINYPGPWKGEVGGKPVYERMSLSDVVDGTFDPSLVKDKVVLIGATAVGTFDQRVTPYDNFVPGVVTHAAVVDNILAKNFLERTEPFVFYEMLLMVVLALVFGLAIPRLNMYGQLGFMAGALVIYGAVDLMFFNKGMVLASVTPMLETVTLCFGMIFYNYVTVDKEKRAVRHAFQHYLTKSVMEEMLKNPEKLKLGGEKRDLSVLFSDIRGFTTISERLPPEELVRTLNEYLTPMTDLVFATEGTLDKYMGDAIMAIWGAPVPQDDHALRACTCALQMMKELEVLRTAWREQGRPDIDIGIGINSGMMSAGNMGSTARFDYTVMGDNVNLGSRLEGTNKEYGTNIIISEFTFEKVKGKVVARELGAVRVKGKKLPVGIYELRGLGNPGPEEAAVIKDFEDGIKAYRARNWDEAERLFNKVMETWLDDGPSGKYLDDIAYKRQHPPPEGWDGVYEMKTK